MSQDIASLEAKISSLDAKSFLVLSKLMDTTTNQQIVRWSGSWNFTEAQIEASLKKIYATLELLHLESSDERRLQAARLYRTFTEAAYPLTGFSRRGKDCHQNLAVPVNAQERREVHMSETREGFNGSSVARQDELSIHITSPVAARFKRLSARELQFCDCLARELSPAAIAAELNISESTVTQYKTVVFNKLQLPRELGIKNRRAIFEQAYIIFKQTPKEIIAESTPVAEADIVPEQLPPAVEPALPQSKEAKSSATVSDGDGASSTVLRLANPCSIKAVRIIQADGAIPAELLEAGYRAESLIMTPSLDPRLVSAHLVLVQRT